MHALVATEDERFYEHSGIDFIALGRAILKRGILGHDNAGGGSTITQQLAKQVFSEKAHSTFERLLQKPIEWIIVCETGAPLHKRRDYCDVSKLLRFSP